MMKATDIKTSRKLERLGLDTATSDCYWESDNKRLMHKLCIGKAKGKHCTPAWTLAALLAVMPESIKVGGEVYVQVMRKWYDTQQECESYYEFSYEDADGFIPSNADYDNPDPTAAAAAMVAWLLSDGHIK